MFIGNIAYRHGEFFKVDQIKTDEQNYEAIAFKDIGLDHYSIVKGDILELAEGCIIESLESSEQCASEIDAIIISSCTFTTEKHPWLRIDKLCSNVGLVNATPYSVGLSQCSSFHYGLKLAHSLVQAGECRYVLLVVADKANEIDLFRVNRDPEFPFVGSDAVASCIIGTNIKNGFKIGSKVAQRFDATLISETPQEEIIPRMIENMEDLFTNFYGENQLEPDVVTQFIGNNYSSLGIDLFEYLSSVHRSKIYKNNVARFSHGFGVDTLINLKDYSEESKLSEEKLVLFGSGTYQWGLVLLER